MRIRWSALALIIALCLAFRATAGPEMSSFTQARALSREHLVAQGSSEQQAERLRLFYLLGVKEGMMMANGLTASGRMPADREVIKYCVERFSSMDDFLAAFDAGSLEHPDAPSAVVIADLIADRCRGEPAPDAPPQGGEPGDVPPHS